MSEARRRARIVSVRVAGLRDDASSGARMGRRKDGRT